MFKSPPVNINCKHTQYNIILTLEKERVQILATTYLQKALHSNELIRQLYDDYITNQETYDGSQVRDRRPIRTPLFKIINKKSY